MAFIIIQNVQRENCASSYLHTWTSITSPKMAGNLEKKQYQPQIQYLKRISSSYYRIQTNASFEILLQGCHLPWLAKRMARASSSPLILVILVITKETCSSPLQSSLQYTSY